MANSTFPALPGLKNGSGRKQLDLIRTERGQYPWAPSFVWTQIVKYSDFSAAALTEALDLNATFTSNPFPSNVWVEAAWIQRITDFAGGTVATADVELGDTGDPNELLTSTDVFTGAGAGIVATPAAAGIATKLFEAAYVPELLLTTTVGNIDELTAGALRVCIVCRPIALLPTS